MLKKKFIVYSYCVNKMCSFIKYTDCHHQEGHKSHSVNVKGVGVLIRRSSIVWFKTDEYLHIQWYLG